MENNIQQNHMEIYWHDYAKHDENRPITEANLTEKASIIGRTGLMLLSCGTGAWRVRSSMNTLSEQLGITCSENIGLMSIDYTCFDGKNCFSQSLCLTNTGVNTSKLNRLEHFVNEFSDKYKKMSGEEIHYFLDQVEQIHGLYSPFALGLAAGLACGGFTFLLGGGIVEIICAFLGAGCGNYLRCKLTKHHITIFLTIVSAIILACLVYAGGLKFAEIVFSASVQHEAGYICAMLFIIPGFPFITSGIDFAKLDMRSGIERLFYSVIIIAVATLTAWLMALLLQLNPIDFPALKIQPLLHFGLRLIAGFCGVFGFSIMFNSPVSLATMAALIGTIANTLRLELVDYTAFPPAAAAFCGSLTAGLLASFLKNKYGYPRISITVPSVVIMIPGLYIYRAVYSLGTMSLTIAADWFSSAMLIILALPLGLIFARILTDRSFRYCT